MYSKFLCATAIILCSTNAIAAEGKWAPTFEIEGRINADRSLASPKFLIPLAQDDSSMLFTDLRSRLDDHNSEEYNVGLGYRQINNGWIYGGYVFADYLSSSNSKQYWQGTAGLEALSENWDFRVNGYLPESTKHQLTAGSPGNIIIDGGGNIFIGGGVGGTYEQALGGFDGEVGYKLPIDDVDLRVFGGAYYFDANDIDSVSGPKARFELTFNEENTSFLSNGMEFTVGAQYQNDGPREGTTTALAQFRVPFGYEGESKKLSKLEKRMTNFIERDVDIVAGEAGGAPIAQEAATIAGESNATIINNSNIGTALSGAGDLVIFNGTININSSLEPDAGQTWIGGGATVAAIGVSSGNVVVSTLPGTHATLNSSVAGYAIDIGNANVNVRDIDIVTGPTGSGVRITADDVQVSGMSISADTASTGNGVFVLNTDNSQVQSVSVDGMDQGLVFDTVTDITLANINVSNSNTNGIFLTTVDGAVVHDIDISDTQNTGFNIDATINLDASDITITNSGVYGFNFSGSGYTELENMTIDTTGWHGFKMNSTGPSVFDNVTIIDAGMNAIDLNNAVLAIGNGFTVVGSGTSDCHTAGINSGTIINYNSSTCP